MKTFSIAELERFTGIKAHTIRVWERRYGLLRPERTDTNFRYYSLEDFRIIADITLLNRFGYKVSYLHSLDATAIRTKVQELCILDEPDKQRQINRLIYAMYAMEIEDFESTLDYCVLSWGIDSTIEEIILPFMDRVQLLYFSNSGNEIHLATTAIRKKLIMGIEKMSTRQDHSKKALFFLPKEEYFDLVLLYMNYVVKSKGYTTLYLGTDIALENIKSISIRKDPSLLFTYLTPRCKFNLDEVAHFLQTHLPQATLVASGFTDEHSLFRVPPCVQLLHHNELKHWLEDGFKEQLKAS